VGTGGRSENSNSGYASYHRKLSFTACNNVRRLTPWSDSEAVFKGLWAAFSKNWIALGVLASASNALLKDATNEVFTGS
jgi:hypothetical protein